LLNPVDLDAASKHALQAFFDSLRSEVADHGIHVSVISPSYIRTNLSENSLTADGTTYGCECIKQISIAVKRNDGIPCIGVNHGGGQWG